MANPAAVLADPGKFLPWNYTTAAATSSFLLLITFHQEKPGSFLAAGFFVLVLGPPALFKWGD